MNRVFTFILISFVVNGFSQNEIIKKSIVENFQYYFSESNNNLANTYSCVFDSTSKNYQLAFHTHLMGNSINVSGCSHYLLYNDTIPLFIRTNSNIVKSIFPSITKTQLLLTNSKYKNLPLIDGERKTFVIFLDKEFIVLTSKWYEYNELIPPNLWDISNDLIKKWNDSISGLNKN